MKVTRTEVKKFTVQSLSNGHMMVEPFYKTKPLEEGATPVGVFTRLAIAQELEKVINSALRRKK